MNGVVVSVSWRKGELDGEAAFSEWVRPHIATMARVAARLAPSGERDDIVQEALVRAWSKRHTFDPHRGSARAWLAAITADRARKARSQRRIPTSVVEASTTTDMEGADLGRAVLALSGRQRLAVDLYYFVGLSIAETALVMRCSEGTVKSTLADARNRLRRDLEG